MDTDMGFTKILQEVADEDDARAYLEALRWPEGPICPHCGSVKDGRAVTAYALKPKPSSRRPVRKGVYKCAGCRKQFTVTVGTIFEDSHIPISKWLLAIHLMCASKKGISAHQLHRMLNINYRSAWFMCHRIRYAMTQPPLANKLSGTVEIDETYIGGKPRKGQVRSKRDARKWAEKKAKVVSLVERGGDVRSSHVPRVTGDNIRKVLKENVAPAARLMTDSANRSRRLGQGYAAHEMVDHSAKEYVRGDAHVQTVEGFFAILKRGIIGTYHHVSEEHLHRYLSEFDFRYNARNVQDGVRALLAIRGAEGKRLMYRDSGIAGLATV